MREIATQRSNLLVSYPDESIGQALNKMSPRGLGRLPVVSRNDPHQLLGLVRRQNIIRAYHLALTRRAEISEQARQLQLETEDGLEVVNLVVAEDALIAGKSVKELANEMPQDSLVISIKKNGRMTIPHGDTIIAPGDDISIILNQEDVEDVYRLLHSEANDAKD